jgi:hypothetical protein
MQVKSKDNSSSSTVQPTTFYTPLTAASWQITPTGIPEGQVQLLNISWQSEKTIGILDFGLTFNQEFKI